MYSNYNKVLYVVGVFFMFESKHKYMVQLPHPTPRFLAHLS